MQILLEVEPDTFSVSELGQGQGFIPGVGWVELSHGLRISVGLSSWEFSETSQKIALCFKIKRLCSDACLKVAFAVADSIKETRSNGERLDTPHHPAA